MNRICNKFFSFFKVHFQKCSTCCMWANVCIILECQELNKSRSSTQLHKSRVSAQCQLSNSIQSRSYTLLRSSTRILSRARVLPNSVVSCRASEAMPHMPLQQPTAREGWIFKVDKMHFLSYCTLIYQFCVNPFHQLFCKVIRVIMLL